MKQGIPPTAEDARSGRLANNAWQMLSLLEKQKQAWRITFLGGLPSYLSLLPLSCNQLTVQIAGFDFLSSNLWVQTAALHWETEHLQFPSTSFILAICAYKSGRCSIFKLHNFLLQLVVLTKLHLWLIAGADLGPGSEDAAHDFWKANVGRERKRPAPTKMGVGF